MYEVNSPKDKKLAELAAAKHGADPFSWRLREDGSFVVILVTGPKIEYTAEEVEKLRETKPAKDQVQPEQQRGYKQTDLQEAIEEASGATGKDPEPDKVPPESGGKQAKPASKQTEGKANKKK